MSRRMSYSMTIDAVRDRTKTVTRRHVDTWKKLAPGDRLTLIEKGMGLPKGAKQVVLCDVKVVAVHVEPLSALTAAECAAEGFPDYTPFEFAAMWMGGHGYALPADERAVNRILCRRIEWRYLRPSWWNNDVCTCTRMSERGHCHGGPQTRTGFGHCWACAHVLHCDNPLSSSAIEVTS